MTTHLMLDLETLGNTYSAVITQIGAVVFSPEQGITEKFFERVDPQTCVDVGMTMGVDTVLWWLKQSDAARAEFFKPSQPLKQSLANFRGFCEKNLTPDSGIWGNGATFDNVILTNAYRLARIDLPWKFWQDRCYRTIKQQLKMIEPDPHGVEHNGLDDAIKQANHLLKIHRVTGFPL